MNPSILGDLNPAGPSLPLLVHIVDRGGVNSTLLPLCYRSETTIIAASLCCGPGIIGLLAVIKESRTAARLYLCTFMIKIFYGLMLWTAYTQFEPFLTRLVWLLLILALELYTTAVRSFSRRGKRSGEDAASPVKY